MECGDNHKERDSGNLFQQKKSNETITEDADSEREYKSRLPQALLIGQKKCGTGNGYTFARNFNIYLWAISI